MFSRFTRYAYKRTSRLRRYLSSQRPILLRLKEFKMYVRPDDWTVGMRIALKRSYEAHVSAIMRPLLKPGLVVVDVGANIGYYTLLAASRIGDAGRVLAFEPNMDNCRLLQMSLEANGFRNVILHPVAVADMAGVVGFATGGSNGSINRDDPTAMPFQVQAVRLDDVLGDYLLDKAARIDLVKMDIEGAEGLALAGMEQLLTRHKPVIFTEFSPAALEVRSHLTPESFLDRIRVLGYDLHLLHRHGGQHPTPQTNAEIMRAFAEYQSDHIDLVAYPRPH
jgi:FkbM family methyltransferase